MYKIIANFSKYKNTRYGRRKGSKNKKKLKNKEPLLNDDNKNEEMDEDSLIKKVSKFMFKRNYPGVYESSTIDKKSPNYVEALDTRREKDTGLDDAFKVIRSVGKMYYLQISFFIFIILGLVFGTPYLLLSTFVLSPETTSTNANDSDAVKKKRISSRGTISSLLSSIIYGVLNGMIDAKGKISPATSTALVGMFYGGTVGFLADISLGSDSGLRELKENFGGGIGFTFGNMATGRYVRYLLTVIFDTFVSLILFKPLYLLFLRTKPAFVKSGLIKRLGFGFLGDNFESLANAIASTLIGIITFQAYANQTRFYWAYPDAQTKDSSSLINTNTMLIAIAIMSMVYLTSNTQVMPGEKGVNHPKNKIIIVCFLLFSTIIIGGLGISSPTLLYQPKEYLLKLSNGKVIPWDLIIKSHSQPAESQTPQIQNTVTQSSVEGFTNNSNLQNYNLLSSNRENDLIIQGSNNEQIPKEVRDLLNEDSIKSKKISRVRIKTPKNNVYGFDNNDNTEVDVDIGLIKDVLVNKTVSGEDALKYDPISKETIKSRGIIGFCIYVLVCILAIGGTMMTSQLDRKQIIFLTIVFIIIAILVPFVYLVVVLGFTSSNIDEVTQKISVSWKQILCLVIFSLPIIYIVFNFVTSFLKKN